MIYILFIWITAGCNTDGECHTMPAYSHAYQTQKACHDAILTDENIDNGAFCVEIPKNEP